MLTAKNVSPVRALEYFVQGYYQQGTSRWYGQGAKKLGLAGEINDEQVFTHILNGRSPDGNQQLCFRTLSSSERRAGTDFTFSAPKSVSLTALVAGDDRLKVAHQIAVEKTLSLIEQRYAHTRVTIDKHRQTISTSNLVIAEFDHIESRELDPHLHTHCLVMNMTQNTDGQWYSHLNDAIFRHKKHLGMVYQSYLANEVQKLGYEIEPRLHGQFEIKGYNERDLVEFSKRRQQILAAAGDHSNWVEREKAWDTTRKNKQPVQPEDLKRKWQQEALALGLNLVQPGEPKPEYRQQPVSITNLSDAIAHCCERNVAFYTEDLERFILEQNLATDLSGLEPLIQQQQSLISIDQHDRYFTTHAAVQRELATIRLMKNGQGKVNAISQTEAVDSLLEQTGLNPGQRQAVKFAATTTDQFIAWQGVAGAGKTFALKELKAIATRNGYAVKGFAPSSQAAKVLGQELGIQGETVAGLLVSNPPQFTEPNQIWIVDEAGLLSAKDAFALLEKATVEQARIILVGDTRQLSAVEAGNPFKSLQQAGILSAYLNESNRQRTPYLKLAVDLIANGRIADGFARLDENGCIQTITTDERLNVITNDYMSATPEERIKTLVLAGTNAERLALTLTIRDQMKAEGTLGHETTAIQLQTKDLTKVQMRYIHNFEVGDVVIPTRSYKRRGLEKGELYEVIGKANDDLTLKTPDGRYLQVDTGFDKAVYQTQLLDIAVGDRLKWTKNDRQLGRRNGQEFVVTAISGNSATIQYQENSHTETINLASFQHLDYALVSTIYSSQGKTADRVIIASDYTIAAESFYVAVSRAKYELKLYTQDKDKLLELAQRTKTQLNPLDLLRLQQQRSLREQNLEHVVENVVKSEKSFPKPQLTKLEESSAINDPIAPPVSQPTQKPKPIIQPTLLTEAFWIPNNISNTPDHIESPHWYELVKGSAIHPEIAALNFRSLKQDSLEHEHEAWSHLMYSEKLERSNTGRLTSGMLRRYAHIDAGGWWCDAGVDPRPQRDIKICFDYETRPETRRNIDIAISRTGSLLQHSGAKVSVVTLPGPDKGVDDFIVARGGQAYEKLSHQAKSLRDWRNYNKKLQLQLPKPPTLHPVKPQHEVEREQEEILAPANLAPTQHNQTVNQQFQQTINESVNQLTTDNTEQQAAKYISAQIHNLELETRDWGLATGDADQPNIKRNSSPLPNPQSSQKILQAINQMNNHDFIQLVNNVNKYFRTKTSKPPLQTDKQNILSEIDSLSHHINDLWSIEEHLKKQIESMQYNPFQVLGRKYSEIQARSLDTLESISQAIARQKQLEQQLTNWEQHHKDHVAWKADPDTEGMRNIAIVLELPQIIQRLTAAKDEIQIQRQQKLAEYEQSRLKQMEQQQHHYHRRGRTR